MTNELMQINPFIRYALGQARMYPHPETHLSYDCRLFYLVHGDFSFTIDQIQYHLTDGDALFVPPAHPYCIAMERTDKVRLLVFNFDCECTGNNAPNRLGIATPDTFDPARVSKTQLFAPFDKVVFCSNIPEIRAECEDTISIFQSERDNYREFASITLKKILIQIDHRMRFSGNQHLKLIAEIKEYIQRYARDPITNECVAKAFGYHSYYLNRLMKQYGGITIAQMVIQERIKYAEMCMTTTDMTIAEIAVASGFSNISYFSRIFREKTGNTPSQYRKSNAI